MKILELTDMQHQQLIESLKERCAYLYDSGDKTYHDEIFELLVVVQSAQEFE